MDVPARAAVHERIRARSARSDNDYRAVVGIENTGGLRIDASSNYGRMTGPLVGLAGNIHAGRSSFRGYLGQSVLLGEAELSGMSREFEGPFSAAPAFVSQETFKSVEDVAIPVTELRIEWNYKVSEHLSFGLAAHSSAWWDVSVPPGVIPIDDGDEALHENTIVLLGLSGAIEIRF